MIKYAAEVFAFLVVIAVIYRYVVPPLRRAMGKRQEAIRAEFDEAREAKEAAEADEAKYRSSTKDVESEVAEIRESAEALAEQIVAELQTKAHDEADRIIQRAHQQLAADRESLIRGIRVEVGGHVVELAGRIVVRSLADQARRAATVDRFLAELDEAARSQGTEAAPMAGRT